MNGIWQYEHDAQVKKNRIFMKESELILQKTNGGLAVFRHYLGEKCLKKAFKSPFREETSPSCHLYLNKRFGSAYYYLQDFGDSSCCGDCFAVVAHLLNLNAQSDFVTLLKTIDHDMCLGIFEDGCTSCATEHTAPQLEQPAVKLPATTVKFVPIIKDFSRGEVEYWKRYGIGLDTLQKYHVYSLRSVTFSKSDGKSFCIFGTQACPAFGYFFNGMNGVKVYRPKAKSRFMYAGKLPHPYVFGMEQLPEHGDTVFITGGEKDVLSLAAHGFSAIAFNSETAKIPEDIMENLASRFGKLVILYDSDATGIRESARIVKEYSRYRICRVQLPLAGTKQEKDISDYFAKGNTAAALQELVSEATCESQSHITENPSKKT